jgi:putative hemolysin
VEKQKEDHTMFSHAINAISGCGHKNASLHHTDQHERRVNICVLTGKGTIKELTLFGQECSKRLGIGI